MVYYVVFLERLLRDNLAKGLQLEVGYVREQGEFVEDLDLLVQLSDLMALLQEVVCGSTESKGNTF